MHVWYVDHESERANCLFYLLLQKMVTLIFGFEYLFNKMEALEKFIANLDNQDTSLLECRNVPSNIQLFVLLFVIYSFYSNISLHTAIHDTSLRYSWYNHDILSIYNLLCNIMFHLLVTCLNYYELKLMHKIIISLTIVHFLV